MNIRKILKKFYNSIPEVVEDILKICENREVGYLLENNKFGQRPSIIENKGDFFSLIDKGAVSFHISLERWSNPMLLKNLKTKKELEEIRIGWDFIIDIDVKNIKDFEIEVGKIVVKEIIEFLLNKNVKKIYLKYSGGKGFHIAIPWEIIPKKIEYLKKGEFVEEDTRKLFPDLARLSAMYIMEKTEKKIKEKILDKFQEFSNIFQENISVWNIIEIDTIAISSRHLIRCLYSINEKTGLLSIPIDINKIDKFEKEYADINKFVYEKIPFLNEEIKEETYADSFFRDVINWKINKDLFSSEYFLRTIKKEEKEIEREINKERKKYKTKISEDLFPPCIKNILNGVEDGRKRSLFILINFLYNIGWTYDEISKKIIEWNNNLNDPLREGYVTYQLEWHKKIYDSKKSYLPPNCNNEMYYKEINICQPDEICRYIKNPLLYPYRKIREREKKNMEEV